MAYTFEEVMTALRNADAAGNTEDAARLAEIASSMSGQSRKAQPTLTPPVQQEQPGLLNQLGRSAASLADTTIGAVIPTVAGMVTYPVARAFSSPEEAAATTERVVGAVDKPFGKAFGVEDTPEYKGEASQRIIQFVGENINKGAQWISQQTGLPVSDVENMIGTLSLTTPAIVRPAAQKASELATRAAADVKAGTRLAFDKPLTAMEQRRSSKDYQRGPQIEAAQEAQRLGIAIPPEAAQPGLSSRITTAIAGDEGPVKLAKANQQNVRKVVLNELGLEPDTQLNSVKPFEEARSKTATPYKQVSTMQTMVADAPTVEALAGLIPDSSLIGASSSAQKIVKLVDDATQKVQKGINGKDLLNNIKYLRSQARKVRNNKNADLAALELADARMGVANILESMIESNISNPRLLSEFRDARTQMAKSYAYQDATDLNTGVVDAGKLAKLTSVDNALTGDIAALGRIAGNFPDAFGRGSLTSSELMLNRLRRSGLTGTLGGLTGYGIGGGFGGAIGAVGGAVAGAAGRTIAANRMANPAYQRGLKISDYRIPAAAQATVAQAPIPNSQALVPYQTPVEVLRPGEGPYNPNFVMAGEGRAATQPVWDAESRTYRGEFPVEQSPVSVGFPEGGPLELPMPSGQSTLNALRAEDARRANISRTLGQEREAAQAAAEAAQRRPATREVILDIDPTTGRLREASQGMKGATPDTFSNFGSSLETAAKKVSMGTKFDMTAAERVAWNKTKVDIAKVQPDFKTLSDKAVAEKMLDRVWVFETAQKARDKAAAFESIAQRTANENSVKRSLEEREKMMDLAEQMEETLRMPRPNLSRKQQGPKTRAAFRENMMSQESTPPGLFTVDINGFPK